MKSIHRYATIALMLVALAGSAAAEGKKSNDSKAQTPCAATGQMPQSESAATQEMQDSNNKKAVKNNKKQTKPAEDNNWLLSIYG
jgi:hypothetical protein